MGIVGKYIICGSCVAQFFWGKHLRESSGLRVGRFFVLTEKERMQSSTWKEKTKVMAIVKLPSPRATYPSLRNNALLRAC